MFSVALAPDVAATIRTIDEPFKRRVISTIVVALPTLNLFDLVLSITVSKATCPMYLKLLAVALYSARVLIGYSYLFRAELALSVQGQSRVQTTVLGCLKIYLLITFALNIGKALVFYSSSWEDTYCKIDFGDGLWIYLDEFMFSFLDIFTFVMLWYISQTSPVFREAGARDMIKRILLISLAPILSTFSALTQMLVDPSTAQYVTAIDFQIHTLCLFIVYAGARQDVEGSMANESFAPSSVGARYKIEPLEQPIITGRASIHSEEMSNLNS